MRVLIVEDEERLASTVRRGLEGEGFSVDVAHDGTDGFRRAREGGYDAIVLDVMLPGMNGYRICSALRREGYRTPILILTAKDADRDEIEALDTGADDFLSKPFSFGVLTARLRALLRRGAPDRPAVLSAGDLSLDPGSHRAWRGETELTLTPKEFGMLQFLLRRAGQVASRGEILEHVWDQDYDGDSNVVDVYMGYLRKKIDTPFRRRSIETVRGIGYRLSADGG
jgi:two-component system OmpR family response regulator